uniref:Uncharacterized protein n=2 Tax=Ixodes scapularis TaxID=6945 RepID=A0A1S4L4W1_IXOSC
RTSSSSPSLSNQKKKRKITRTRINGKKKTTEKDEKGTSGRRNKNKGGISLRRHPGNVQARRNHKYDTNKNQKQKIEHDASEREMAASSATKHKTSRRTKETKRETSKEDQRARWNQIPSFVLLRALILRSMSVRDAFQG